MNIVETQRKVITEVIKLYQSHRLLWDHNDPKYNNKHHRAKSIQELLKVYQKIHAEATADILKKKLENLRTSFKKEYLKVKKAQVNGEEYVPTLWYYNLFLFLVEVVEPVYSRQRILRAMLTDKPITYEKAEIIAKELSEEECSNQSGEEEEIECEFLEDDESYTDNSAPIIFNNEPTPAKRPKTKHPRQAIQSEKQLTNINHCRAFGETVGLQLQDLDLEQQYIAQKLISDVIFMARYKKLTARSFLQTSDHASRSESITRLKMDPLNE